MTLSHTLNTCVGAGASHPRLLTSIPRKDQREKFYATLLFCVFFPHTAPLCLSFRYTIYCLWRTMKLSRKHFVLRSRRTLAVSALQGVVFTPLKRSHKASNDLKNLGNKYFSDLAPEVTRAHACNIVKCQDSECCTPSTHSLHISEKKKILAFFGDDFSSLVDCGVS